MKLPTPNKNGESESASKFCQSFQVNYSSHRGSDVALSLKRDWQFWHSRWNIDKLQVGSFSSEVLPLSFLQKLNGPLMDGFINTWLWNYFHVTAATGGARPDAQMTDNRAQMFIDQCRRNILVWGSFVIKICHIIPHYPGGQVRTASCLVAVSFVHSLLDEVFKGESYILYFIVNGNLSSMLFPLPSHPLFLNLPLHVTGYLDF